MKEAIRIAEDAFKEKGEDKVQMPSKTYVNFSRYNGDLRVMPAYLEQSDVAGVKVVNVHPHNPKMLGIPSIMATIVLIDPKTGFPVSIMDGTWITALRTGAVGGVAAKYMSRADSKTAAIIGAGVQSRTQLAALMETREIARVKVMDISPEAQQRFIKEMSESFSVEILATSSVEEAVEDADIIVTVTPASKPILMNYCVDQGVHINAFGADAPGKQELDPMIFRRAKVVVDDLDQASHGGEIQHALANRIIETKDIYGDLGEIVAGAKAGRVSEEEITVFDSTGLAIHDVAVAWRIYEVAYERGIGQRTRLVLG